MAPVTSCSTLRLEAAPSGALQTQPFSTDSGPPSCCVWPGRAAGLRRRHHSDEYIRSLWPLPKPDCRCLFKVDIAQMRPPIKKAIHSSGEREPPCSNPLRKNRSDIACFLSADAWTVPLSRYLGRTLSCLGGVMEAVRVLSHRLLT